MFNITHFYFLRELIRLLNNNTKLIKTKHRQIKTLIHMSKIKSLLILHTLLYLLIMYWRQQISFLRNRCNFPSWNWLFRDTGKVEYS